jgi:hypothetical protein
VKDLFGNRVRPVPTPLEFGMQCSLADLLRQWINPAWKFTHLPFGEKRSPATGERLKRMGVTAGWPDFMFVGPHARAVFVELKRKGSGRLSEQQINIRSHLMRCGFTYLVTDSLDDAVKTLQDLSILPNTIRVQ